MLVPKKWRTKHYYQYMLMVGWWTWFFIIQHFHCDWNVHTFYIMVWLFRCCRRLYCIVHPSVFPQLSLSIPPQCIDEFCTLQKKKKKYQQTKTDFSSPFSQSLYVKSLIFHVYMYRYHSECVHGTNIIFYIVVYLIFFSFNNSEVYFDSQTLATFLQLMLVLWQYFDNDSKHWEN